MKQEQIRNQSRVIKNLEEKTFLEHLTELKNRFFIWFLFLIFFSALGYFLHSTIISLLIKPLNKPLYYTSPAGGFELVFNTSLFFGFIASLPILIYQVIKFIQPGFQKISVMPLIQIVFSSLALAITGIVICYLLILPPSLNFLAQFGQGELSALISTHDYFSFVTKYLVSFAIIFQMPLIMLTINKVSALKTSKLVGNIRYVILISFIVSAVLTPTPDLINQTIMAIPIVLLYLISVVLVVINQIKTKPVAAK